MIGEHILPSSLNVFVIPCTVATASGACFSANEAVTIFIAGIHVIAEIKNMSLSIYAIGCTPAGPTKGGGGKIDYPISCGNVNVNAGDIIIGDDDGIAVIPLEQSEELLKLSINRISMEEKIINKLKNGIEHKVIFDITEV